MFDGEKRRVFAASNALDWDSDFRRIRFGFSRRMLPAATSHSRERAGQLSSWK
jgi:hypothetical protein